MTTKIATNIDQSKKLAEILPLESADMNYWCGTQIRIGGYRTMDKDLDVPCWSLTALLDVLSKWAECANEAGITELSYEKETKWGISMLNCGKIEDCYSNNPVDSCYEMILKLHELNLL